jgi:septum formation protein
MMNEIVLASASLGRKKLFQQHFNHFITSISNIDETRIKTDDPRELTKKLALLKAKSISRFYDNDFVIGFDTVVVCEDKILGKPQNKNEAREILKFLSGKKQTVITGFSIIHKQKNISVSECAETTLLFKKLDNKFIEEYTQNHPVTKFAGGYGVQDKDDLIQIIEGDFDNVIGAPMKPIISTLLSSGLSPDILKEEE